MLFNPGSGSPSGDLYCRSRWISFTINIMFKRAALEICCSLGFVLTYMLRNSPTLHQNSPTLHHPRRAAGSAITQRRFLSLHDPSQAHLKTLGLRSGTGPLQTCVRGQVRHGSCLILSVRHSPASSGTRLHLNYSRQTQHDAAIPALKI